MLPDKTSFIRNLFQKFFTLGDKCLSLKKTENIDQIIDLFNQRKMVERIICSIISKEPDLAKAFSAKFSLYINQEQEILQLLEDLKKELQKELLETKKIRRNLEKYSVNKNESRKIDF